MTTVPGFGRGDQAVESHIAKFEQYGLHPRLPDKYDHSTSGVFQECERMFYWQHILGRVPTKVGWALHWGKVTHLVVEEWRETRNTDAVFQIITDNLPEITDDRYGRNRRKMVDLFIKWVEFNEANPIKVLYNEQPVLLVCREPCMYNDGPLGCNLAYGGKLDTIVEWQGIAGPLDVKTTVMEESDPIAEYKPSHQMRGYDWLASHIIGKHCWGVILEKIVCNKSKLFVKRFPISYHKDSIREWADQERRRQALIVDRWINHAFEPEGWLQNEFRCYKPYPCAYRDICTSPRDMDFRLKLIRDTTVEARWDFLNPTQRDALVEAVAE